MPDRSASKLTLVRPGMGALLLVGAPSLLFDILVISRFLSRVVGLFDTVVDARRQKDSIERLGQILGRTELDASNDALNVLYRRDHQVLSGQIVKCS